MSEKKKLNPSKKTTGLISHQSEQDAPGSNVVIIREESVDRQTLFQKNMQVSFFSDNVPKSIALVIYLEKLGKAPFSPGSFFLARLIELN